MKRIHISPPSFVVYPLLAYFCGVRMFLIFALSVLFHEMGHLFVMFFFRQKVVSITVTVGGLDIRRYGKSSYSADAFISVSGPALGLFVGYIGLLLGYDDFFYVSAVYTFLNLLPVYPLDGGYFLRAVLLNFFDYEKAHAILRSVSTLFLFAVYIASVLILLFTEWNISLLAICICIFSLTFFREKM